MSERLTVVEVLAVWRLAEHVLEQTPRGTVGHRTALQIRSQMRGLYRRLRDRTVPGPEPTMAAARETLDRARASLAAVADPS